MLIRQKTNILEHFPNWIIEVLDGTEYTYLLYEIAKSFWTRFQKNAPIIKMAIPVPLLVGIPFQALFFNFLFQFIVKPTYVSFTILFIQAQLAGSVDSSVDQVYWILSIENYISYLFENTLFLFRGSRLVETLVFMPLYYHNKDNCFVLDLITFTTSIEIHML